MDNYTEYKINNIIANELLTFIKSNKVLENNYAVITDLIKKNKAVYSNKDYNFILMGLQEYFKDNYDKIVYTLYSDDREGCLSSEDFEETTKSGIDVLHMCSYVGSKVLEYNNIEELNTHLINKDLTKITSMYMYFMAKDILTDNAEEDGAYNPYEDFWDEITKNYKVIKVSKYNAISKIKRNAIYNTGLGLKLAVKAFSKDF
jgi:hypothetical protein